MREKYCSLAEKVRLISQANRASIADKPADAVSVVYKPADAVLL